MKFFAKPRYIEWNGLRLPPREWRFCTQEWKDDAFYVESAKEEVERLARIAGLNEHSRILDIGSGQGRLAIGLSASMPAINYMGIDVDKMSIDWCKENITEINKNFRFIFVDIENPRYNPAGQAFQPPLQLPFADMSFDVIVLYSVFTHMLSHDLRVYLSELARLLSPKGKAFFTVYAEERCENVAENPVGYLEELGSSSGRVHRVRYRRQFLVKLIERAGLRVLSFDYRSESITKQSTCLVMSNIN